MTLCALAVAAFAAAPAATAAKPKLSVKDARAAEGNKLVFVVTLSRRVNKPTSAKFATAPGTATSADFVKRSGRVTVKAHSRKARIVVTTKEDTADEPNEQLSVSLSRPRNAKLGRKRAAGTITDDDLPVDPGPPTVSFGGDFETTEGNPANPGTALLQVSISAISNKTVSVQYALTGGTAAADDFQSSSGTVTIPPGSSFGSINLNLAGDHVDEGTEAATFTLSNPVNADLGSPDTASVTINDDDTTTGLVISEIFANPSGTPEANFEYIELYNSSVEVINLAGLEVYVGSNLRCSLTGSITPGDYYVVSNDTSIRDEACPLTLLNTGASVQIRSPAPIGAVLDDWTYTMSQAVSGSSLTLKPAFLTTTGNDVPANSCTSTSPYGSDGNFGTPGAANEQCT